MEKFWCKKLMFWITITLINRINTQLFYPSAEYISINKPREIQPIGSSCGIELKDTLCDNRIKDSKGCSNSSSIFFCDQSCPYGNVLQNLTALEQLKLDQMNPCSIRKDFSKVLFNSSSKFSFYLNKDTQLCNENIKISRWIPFNLETSKSNPSLSFINSRTSSWLILNSGFTFSIWFQQVVNTNGYSSYTIHFKLHIIIITQFF
jgi:hypothetical protein